MSTKKTVLLLSPHHLQKSGRIWELLHITKEKNTTAYAKEPVSTIAIRKYFPKLPDTFSSQVSRFSEKNMIATRLEIIATARAARNDEPDNWIEQAFERKLHQELTALRPLLPMVQCYHQVPSTADKNRFTTGPCAFSSYTPGLRFQVRKHNDGYLYLETEVELNGSFYPLDSFTQSAFLIEHKGEYFVLRFTDYKTLCWVQQLDWQKEGADPMAFSHSILAHLGKDYPVSRNALLGTVEITASPAGQVLLSEISGQFLMLTPQFEYDGFVVDGKFEAKAVFQREGKEYTLTRNKEEEQHIIAQVESLHTNFSKQVNGYYYLSFDEARKKNWFLKAFRKLLELDIQVMGMDMLQHFRYCPDKPITHVEMISEEGDQLWLKFTLNFGKEEIPFTELQKVIRAGQQALPLKDGSIALLEEDWLLRYAIPVKHAVAEKGKIRIPKWLALSLEQRETHSTGLPGIMKEEWKAKWKQWQTSEAPLYPLPSAIQASLRIYQQKGYEWLKLLQEAGAGMFLADDMGLGKTLQTICFAASLLQQHPGRQLLIICPASLIYNWEHELKKFAPSLSANVYHGTGRNKQVFTDNKIAIVISSYGTLRSDADLFYQHRFLAVILDESHAIKNPSSQVARVAHALLADHRVSLSGTPVMNNTFDLYSQLQFILPGMFGSQPFFKKEYADPIDRDKNEQRIKDLNQLTAPFILRRTKEQVAKDLPPKTEMILWCQMEEGQRQVYDEIRGQVRGELQASIKEMGLGKSKLQVLQGILKLRQVCNSPALLKNSEYDCTDSVKTMELLEEIENNLSDHKALVFSQFTTMLDILAQELKQRHIPFLLLTGATPAKERDRMVQEFNKEGSDARVFLLSLKAGNAGLNLTAADYVFLFDPWWNNAVEQQAIDRTHRIGQTKNVFAYKLICKDSIEERIIQLQEQKKTLAGSLISEEEGFVKALTEEDIEYLLG
ncbi:MAG: SNF2-related protein [Bacteroidetes bacterium]|nr:SNF2-related protein [Bacteroidota bacterium]